MSLEFLLALSALLLPRLLSLYPFSHPYPQRAVLQSIFVGASYLLIFQMDRTFLLLLPSIIALIFINEYLISRSTHHEATSLCSMIVSFLFIGIATTTDSGLALRQNAINLFNSIDNHVPVLDLSLSSTNISTWLIFTGLLLLSNEANLLIRAVFRYCGLTPDRQAALRHEAHAAQQALQNQNNLNQNPADNESTAAKTTSLTEPLDAPINDGAFRAGRVIGFLERWLMLLVIVGGHDLGALAFIIAAKGLARIKQLEDRAFAEYMLIGTLMSALLSLVVGLWIKPYLSVPT